MRPGGPFVSGLAGLLVMLTVAIGAGTVLGVGPLAPSPAPREVTDPDEILARSLQAVIDADAVHLDGTMTGTIPAGLLRDGATGSLSLDGTTLSVDVRPGDGKTEAYVSSPGLGVDAHVVTVWDSAYTQVAGAVAWTRVSLGDASADAGIDINPLTLVDRLRAYLRTPGSSAAMGTVRCAAPGGWCRLVRLDAGPDPLLALGMVLPPERAAAIDAEVVLTLEADIETLRPVRLVAEAADAGRTVDVRLVLEAGEWDGDIAIEEPPPDLVAAG